MIVLGGTYRERCQNPVFDELRGSGFRAGIALRSVGDVEFHSCVDDATSEEAAVLADTFATDADTAFGTTLAAQWESRTEPVSFDYFTPLGSPAINGRLAERPSFDVAGDAVLVFGMIEEPPTPDRIRGDRVVVDPQQPRGLAGPPLDGIEASQLALVANRSETRAMGQEPDVWAAARKLAADPSIDIVVTKLGAIGALVTTSASQQPVPVYPTPLVRALGSGDVFAAAFAHAWAQERQDPIDAADYASQMTSLAVSSNTWDFALSSHAGRLEALPAAELTPRVYLAGPFFDLSQRWLVETVRDSLTGLGGSVFSPLHDVGPGDDTVALQDLEGLDDCTCVVALLDGADAGTLFECGYATANAVPVVGYAENPDPEGHKMLRGTGAETHTDLSTAVYRAIWRAMGAPGV